MGHSTSKFSGELCIPFDVLNLILDSFDRDTLRAVSTLNQNINREVNKRLWSCVVITHTSTDFSKRQRRRSIVQRCNAVIRDPRRAKCIRDVRIRFYYPLGTWRIYLRPVWRKICTALELTTRLHTLGIEAPIHEEGLARALSRHSHKFIFSLKTLRSSLTIAHGIGAFLAGQPEIQHYYVDYDLQFSYGRYDPDVVVNDDLPKTLLPSLREVYVSRSRVRSVVLGRTLDSVHVSDICTHQDVNQVLNTLGAAHAEKAVVRHLEFSALFPSTFDRHIPTLINFWGISETRICSLRICAHRMPNQTDLPSILTHFPFLESLEWTNCQDYEALAIPPPPTVDDAWYTRFVQECSRNCPSLERLTFTYLSGPSRDWVAQDVPDSRPDVYHGKGIWTRGGKLWKDVHDGSHNLNFTSSAPMLMLLD